MITCIYKIINLTNNKTYIGSAKDFEQRKTKHLSLLRLNKHPNIHLQRAFNLSEESNFSFDIVELCSEEDLISREQYYIDLFGYDNLYNICRIAGNTLGRKLSEDAKSRISNANKGNKAWLGRRHNQATKNVISDKNTKYHFIVQSDKDENVIGTYSSVNDAADKTGIPYGSIWNSINDKELARGYMFSASLDDIKTDWEINNKKREFQISILLKNVMSRRKPVLQIDKISGTIIKQWNSSADACRELGLDNSSMSMCANGKLKSTGGYIWRYVDDKEI